MEHNRRRMKRTVGMGTINVAAGPVYARIVPRVSLTQSSNTLISMLFSLFDTPILSQNNLIAAAGYPR